MTRYAALAVCSLALGGALTGCDSDSAKGQGPAPLSRTALEKRVAGSFTPDDPQASIDAHCEGGIDARRGARRDCHLQVGEESADVHVQVTGVDGDRPQLRVTPYVPADRLGEALRSALTGQGYQVDSVTCEDELPGEEDASTSCTASPSRGEGQLAVHVTKVDGLMVNFDYEVVR